MISARIWREQRRRYRNEVTRCKRCGEMHYPPRKVCDRCGGREMEIRRMCDTGVVLSYTVIHVAPPAFASDVPYVVAAIEMDDDTRLMVQVADVEPEHVSVGMKVRLEFRKIRQYGATGVICYGHKAVPS